MWRASRKGKGKNKHKPTESKLYKNVGFFFGKLLSFYYNDVIINFDPVSVPWKGEREKRLRICKITSPKGKRKKCKKKQSETGRKDYVKNRKQE